MRIILIVIYILFSSIHGYASDSTPLSPAASNVLTQIDCDRLLQKLQIEDNSEIRTTTDAELKLEVKKAEVEIKNLKTVYAMPADSKESKPSDALVARAKATNERFDLVLRLMQLKLEKALIMYRKELELAKER